MNLQVLKRQDADVQDIVDTASHVVIYEFDQGAQSWTYPLGFAIYGIWFFPEEDRAKILLLFQRLIHSLKAPQSATIMDTAQQPTKVLSPVKTQAKPKMQQQQQTSQPTQQQEQQQERPVSQSRNRGRSRSKQDDAKRRGASATNPTAILQRDPKDKRSNSSSSGGSANSLVKQQQIAPVVTSSNGMIPISKADGAAAGEAIMDMISQNRVRHQHKHLPTASSVNKEQLKQTLIGLLDDTQFFDQIYYAYVDRMSNRG
uniref:mRNA-decapping enzyme C-terminal domain-containing protein n=1 Tax=Hyaloperonospora arabidopsidis (strain Emoy2) TaxID=559515 RepID=M4BDQ7_HYAAE